MTRPDLDAILPPVSAEDEATVDALLAKAREGVGKRPIGGRPDLGAIALLAYVDELERRTTYSVGETEWAQRIAVAEQRYADERAAHEETRELLTGLWLRQRKDDAEQMRSYGLTYDGVRRLIADYDAEEMSFGKLMELLRAAAWELAEERVAMMREQVAAREGDVALFKRLYEEQIQDDNAARTNLREELLARREAPQTETEHETR